MGVDMTKILLVEDDKSLREIYGVRLLAEGYQIASAGDGEEALAMAVKERPDLIIADVMMPKISGFDMLDILRSTPETKEIKVIMMTALSSEDQRARGESLGANRYLVKSQVGIEDVVRTVHDVLADSPVAAAPVIPSFGTPAAPVIASQPAKMPDISAATETTPAVPASNTTTPVATAAPTVNNPQPIAPTQTPETISNNNFSASTQMPTAQTATVTPMPPSEFPISTPKPATPITTTPVPTPALEQPAPTASIQTPASPAVSVQIPIATPAATPASFSTPSPAQQIPVTTPTPATTVPSQLPQPTAPFSTPSPVPLVDRTINPAVASSPMPDIANLITQELNGSSMTPPPTTPAR